MPFDTQVEPTATPVGKGLVTVSVTVPEEPPPESPVPEVTPVIVPDPLPAAVHGTELAIATGVGLYWHQYCPGLANATILPA